MCKVLTYSYVTLKSGDSVSDGLDRGEQKFLSARLVTRFNNNFWVCSQKFEPPEKTAGMVPQNFVVLASLHDPRFLRFKKMMTTYGNYDEQDWFPKIHNLRCSNGCMYSRCRQVDLLNMTHGKPWQANHVNNGIQLECN